MSDYSILQELLELARSTTGAEHAAFVLDGDPHSIELRSPLDDSVEFEIDGSTTATVRVDELPGGARVVTHAPIIGPLGDSGWIAVMHRDGVEPDHALTLDVVTRVASLIEERLDREAEQVRLDEVGELLRSNQERLHATRDQLSLSNQELEQFAYIAAHELVAPLRAVAVYAEVLESVTPASNSESASGARDCVNEIRAGVQQMTRQVQALLELSNNELDADSAVPIEVGQVVQAALDTLALTLDEIHAVVQVEVDLPTVLATAVPLQSVFANLFSNAIRYRSPDKQLEIQISSAPTDDGFRIEVTDNGTGVAEGDRARIFQMFERASTTEDGSGIGLALSRKILNKFGASIGVEAGASAGSIFWLQFPPLGAVAGR